MLSRIYLTVALVIAVCCSVVMADEATVSSRIEKTPAGERILIEEVELNAPLARVWRAYTTSEGWMGWAAPKAEVELKVGGSIATQYDPEANIGDPGTNRLQIVNYVPQRLLTLRADISENWPEVMKEDADNLSNVILFEAVSPTVTRIQSYGIGYRDVPDYDRLMEFFVSANVPLYEKLRQYVERESAVAE